MVKVYSIVFFQHKGVGNPPVILASEYSLGDFSFFYRGNVQEVIQFASREVARHVEVGSRGGVTKKTDTVSYNCYYQVVSVDKSKDVNLCCTVCTDGDYPKTVAISLVAKAIREFLQANPAESWVPLNLTKDTQLKKAFLLPMLTKYQNPQEADDIEKVKKDLEEVKEVLLESMDLLLQREEKLGDLVDKSNDLSATSKVFVQKSGDLNSCCILY
eukprot:TRINITY_DN967_c0_g1_i1.p1 TRINITY_DN967_c0_g1~~TRINITY_DN967_c0_g1_i1.p1  ORF type:complete len:215 (-),score=47.00 TRINITY_DN967_c0_g1_i1:505-1149(-)